MEALSGKTKGKFWEKVAKVSAMWKIQSVGFNSPLLTANRMHRQREKILLQIWSKQERGIDLELCVKKVIWSS